MGENIKIIKYFFHLWREISSVVFLCRGILRQIVYYCETNNKIRNFYEF
jgi:hypothetical protein